MGRGSAADFNTAVMYLISFVAPRLEASFIHSEYSAIYAKMSGAMGRFLAVGPFIRAAVVVLQRVLESFEAEEWEERSSLNEMFAILMQLVVDPRPKVRKLAQDSLLALVRSGAISASHPAKSDLISFAVGVLQQASRKESGDALHLIPLLRSLGPRISRDEFALLLDALLRVAALGNTHLTVSVYNFLAMCCDRIIDRMQTEELPSQPTIDTMIAGMYGQIPGVALTEVIPHWMNALVKAHLAGDQLFRFPSDRIRLLFKTLFSFLAAVDSVPLQSVEESLRLSLCMVRDEALGAFICTELGAHLTVKNSPVAPVMIRSAADFCQEVAIDVLPTASKLVVLLAQMHDSKQTQHASLIEKTLGKFVARCGVEEILALIPLNLGSTGKGETPRAWLLPVIKEYASQSRLEYFMKELLPLAENMLSKSTEYSRAGKENDAKVYHIIFVQIWSTLSAFLFCPVDFTTFFPSLAPILGKCLNGLPQLRPIIANALAAMINRGKSLEMDLEETAGVEVCARAAADLHCLAQFSGNFVPILFNIYGATEAEQRGYLLGCIDAFLSITPVGSIKDYFYKVLSRLSTGTLPTELVSFLELGTVLVRSQELEEYERLLTAALPLISSSDMTVQKRAYRVIGDLLCREDFIPDYAVLEQQLLAAYESARIDSAVKKGRFRVLLKISSRLPDDALHWIPLFLPEIVLGTKEVNQQARLEAFELLLAFARRMTRGGIIVAEKTQGMLTSDTVATLNEFMTMVMAGLAGSTPHMISASIMALARILFELRLSLDREMLDTLLGDIIAVLQSPSREVVKSALGFIKVALVSLKGAASGPDCMEDGASKASNSMLGSRLAELVPSLLNWSNEHHQHFKIRVRHLMERLVRQFGFEAVWKVTPVEHQKLLTNIRKRRERLKRQQKEGQVVDDDADDQLGEEYGLGRSRDDALEALTSAALSKATVLTRNTSAAVLRPSKKFESALNDSESELDSASDDNDDYQIPADSILNDLADLDDEDEIENVLCRKLSLATTLRNRGTSLKRTVRQLGRDSDEEDDGKGVRMGDDGMLHISDEESDGHGSNGSGDEATPVGRKAPASSKRVRFGEASVGKVVGSKKGKRGDTKRKGEKFEPFSYLPMTRATKANQGGKKARSTAKPAPKYYMKRS